MLTFFLAYLFCGICVGFLGGLLGIGGGIIGIPLLLEFFNRQGMADSLAMHMAIGTLLATAVPTTFAALCKHYQKQMISFLMFKQIVPGLILGCIMGTILSSHTSSIWLQRIFAFFLLFIAWQMLLSRQLEPRHALPNQKYVLITTIFIGMLSGLLGLGGGVLLVPYLSWCGIPIKHAVATATACILPAAIIGALSYMLIDVKLANASNTGFIYWPAFFGITMTSILFAPMGAKWAHSISTTLLKNIFAVILIMVAIKLFVSVH